MSTSLCSAVTYSTGLGEREAEGEREDISCIISCSSTRCLSDLVHDMPPCFSVSSSLALLYLIPSLHPPVSLTDAHFICLPVFPSQLYLFPRMFIRLFSPPCTHGLQLAAEEAHSEPGRACLHAPPPLPIRARRQIPPLPLHPFLTTRSRGSVFCCSWMALSKSLFVRPVCLSCMSDENSDPFFPTRSASSGIIAGPSAPLHTHTRAHTHTPLKHHIFHFLGMAEEPREEIQYIYENNLDGCCDERSLDCGYTPTGKVRGR